MDEDELLKELFRKVKLEKPPENMTLRIMDHIRANPSVEPVRKLQINWWWPVIGLLSLYSMYATGVFEYLYQVYIDYLSGSYGMFSDFFMPYAEVLHTVAGIVSASFILKLIFPAILIILMTDFIIGQGHRKVTGL
jgi:hypothetical protein